MFRLKGDKAKNFPREYLYAGETVPEEVALHGMTDLEKELTKQFHDKQKSRDETARLLKKIQSPLVNLISSDKNAASGMKEMREMLARRKMEKLMPTKVAKAKEERRIGLSQCEAYDNVVPPFNYQWTWKGVGGPGNPGDGVNANKESAIMDFYLVTDDYNDLRSYAAAAAAVGIYFRPSFQEGTFQFWSTPSVRYGWADNAFFGSCHSEGWIGLYAGRYNLDGSFDGAPVYIKNSLWFNSIDWGWSYNHDENTLNNPIYSPQFNVDRDHWYAIWVWCGGSVDGDGVGPISFSTANGLLDVNVPSISWDLLCNYPPN
jgi:hypothetical protein